MKKALALLAVVAASSSAIAVPITGSINISGVATPDNTDLTLATVINPVVANSAVVTGDYAELANSGGNILTIFPVATTFTYSSFNIATGPVSIVPLWTLTQGSFGASFDLQNISNFTVTGGSGAQTLNVFGTGMAYLTTSVGGTYDPTPGNWTFTLTSADAGTFTFTAADSPTVPDGGATAMLLGAGIVGLGLVRRKVA